MSTETKSARKVSRRSSMRPEVEVAVIILMTDCKMALRAAIRRLGVAAKQRASEEALRGLIAASEAEIDDAYLGFWERVRKRPR